MEFYSKVDEILLKSGWNFTQKWMEFYSKVNGIFTRFHKLFKFNKNGSFPFVG